MDISGFRVGGWYVYSKAYLMSPQIIVLQIGNMHARGFLLFKNDIHESFWANMEDMPLRSQFLIP